MTQASPAQATGVRGHVLVIAGSDSGGGAGIQGDIKTITALGGYASTAITALTAQNTLGVQAVMPVPLDFIAQQIAVVQSDMAVDAIKMGMLHSAEVIARVAAELDKGAKVPLIIDPVMRAKGGAPLIEPDAVSRLRDLLVPRAQLLTPNIPEAEALVGCSIANIDQALRAAEALVGLGAEQVLVKSGHLPGAMLQDWLVDKEGARALGAPRPRIETAQTHGTGCAFASAAATGVAQGLSLFDATRRAVSFVDAAIRHAPGLGAGHGPLGHGFGFSMPDEISDEISNEISDEIPDRMRDR